MVALTSTVTNNTSFIFLITKREKNLTKTCTNVPSTNNTLRHGHEHNSFQIKLSHNILVRKKREEKTNNKERQKYKAEQTLRQKKERVADELTDQMKHYLLYVIFILRNQVKAPLVIMDERLGWHLLRTMWF